jgi:carbamoylphosphate synthase small subunit
MQGTLHLKDGSKYDGESFGALKALAGEVVFIRKPLQTQVLKGKFW